MDEHISTFSIAQDASAVFTIPKAGHVQPLVQQEDSYLSTCYNLLDFFIALSVIIDDVNIAKVTKLPCESTEVDYKRAGMYLFKLLDLLRKGFVSKTRDELSDEKLIYFKDFCVHGD